jgi:hypothetical protein
MAGTAGGRARADWTEATGKVRKFPMRQSRLASEG